MGLRDLVQGLIAPAPQPARPWRRTRGTLLVPQQFLRTGGTSNTPFGPTVLSPGASESPPLPDGSWLINSFAIQYQVVVLFQSENSKVAVNVPVQMSLSIIVDHRPAWSGSIAQSVPLGAGQGNFEMAGAVFADLVEPIRFGAGSSFAFALSGVIPRVPGEEAPKGLNGIEITLPPVQIPYSVEGVNP